MKLQILVSLRVFGMESHYICTFGYRLSLTAVHKETMVSLQAFLSFLSRAHPNCPLPLLTPAAQASPSMVSFIFWQASRHFYMWVPPGGSMHTPRDSCQVVCSDRREFNSQFWLNSIYFIYYGALLTINVWSKQNETAVLVCTFVVTTELSQTSWMYNRQSNKCRVKYSTGRTSSDRFYWILVCFLEISFLSNGIILYAMLYRN